MRPAPRRDGRFASHPPVSQDGRQRLVRQFIARRAGHFESANQAALQQYPHQRRHEAVQLSRVFRESLFGYRKRLALGRNQNIAPAEEQLPVRLVQIGERSVAGFEDQALGAIMEFSVDIFTTAELRRISASSNRATPRARKNG